MNVRTRFAPSPTGSLHVGSVRTALFSWLFARHHQGKFILRIEDTDQERSTQESVNAILQGMQWLGLTWDEGPYYQTERYQRYQAVADQLLGQGLAYRCNCSKERLEMLRAEQLANKEKPRYDGHCRNLSLDTMTTPYVVRFKNSQEGVVTFSDQVYGDIHVANSELDDFVMIRSDGHPTYNFAVVIDDWDMAITHVIRGDDHINNTPRQINLFRALQAPVPEFAHLPMILGEDGKRLSKRHGAVNVLQFKSLGFLPHALLNYLVRLGWSSGDQEIFSMDEMIQQFDLQRVNRGAAGFNYEKLHWLNQHYLKSDDPIAVADALAWQFEQQGISIDQGPALTELIAAQADRCKTLAEICEKSVYFYRDDIDYDEEMFNKHVKQAGMLPLKALYERFQLLTDWNRDSVQGCINDVCAALNVGMGKVAQPLRVAVTGGTTSPSIDITLVLLGKARVLRRLEELLAC